MDIKKQRQETVLELARKESFATQNDLTKRLKSLGFKVDQGTVSRDLKELGLVKVNSSYKSIEELNVRLKVSGTAVAKRFVKKIQWSGNLMVIKTDPGTANTVASCLDKLDIPELLGTVAGDDTIIGVLAKGARRKNIENQILG